MHEIISIFKSIVISTLFIIALLFLIFRLQDIPRSFPILLFIVSLLGVTGPRVFYRVLKDKLIKTQSKIPVLVVGDNDTSENFIRLTKIEKNSPYNVVGIVGTKKSGIGRRIHNIPIISSVDELDDLKIKIKNLELQRVIISDNTIDSNLIESLYIFSKKKWSGNRNSSKAIKLFTWPSGTIYCKPYCYWRRFRAQTKSSWY